MTFRTDTRPSKTNASCVFEGTAEAVPSDIAVAAIREGLASALVANLLAEILESRERQHLKAAALDSLPSLRKLNDWLLPFTVNNEMWRAGHEERVVSEDEHSKIVTFCALVMGNEHARLYGPGTRSAMTTNFEDRDRNINWVLRMDVQELHRK